MLHSIAHTLKKNSGRVLVRDYAEGDLAESRLAASSRQQKLQDNFYVRGDGTRAFYFSEAGLRKLFAETGYSCENMHVHERTIENRRKGLLMERRWIQAVFVFTGAAPPASNSTGMLLHTIWQWKGYENRESSTSTRTSKVVQSIDTVLKVMLYYQPPTNWRPLHTSL